MSNQPANTSLCCSFRGKSQRGEKAHRANEADSHEPDLGQMLLAAVESHETTFTKLVELSDRVGGRLPGSIKDAIVGVGSALRRAEQELTSLTEFLARKSGPSGSATPAPRD